MSNFTKLFFIFLVISTNTLVAKQEKGVARVYMPTKPRNFSMILLNKIDNKPISKDIYGSIQPYIEVKKKYLAKASNLAKKVGFIDTKGKWIVAAKLDLAKNFSKSGIARVKVSDKWGYIRSDGSWLVKPKFNYVYPFYYGFGLVQEKNRGEFYFINSSAQRLSDKNYSNAHSFCHDGTAAVAIRHTITHYEISNTGVTKKQSIGTKEYWGKIDNNGTQILPFEFRRNDAKLKCKMLPRENKKKRKTAKLVQRKWHWGVLSASKKFIPFPDNIISILENSNGSKPATVDGIFTTITKDRTLEYFDENVTLKYIYKPGKDKKMTLFDAKGKVVYHTNIDAFKIYSVLNRGVEELFVNPKNYNSSKIIAGIKKMMSKKFKRYQVPNMLFESANRDPYKIIDSNENVKNGRIWVLAKGYKDETEWGNHDFLLDYESQKFSKYSKQIAKWISATYGKPVYAKYGKYIWKIKDKMLKLDTASDTGDGDFYHLLALEVYKEDK